MCFITSVVFVDPVRSWLRSILFARILSLPRS